MFKPNCTISLIIPSKNQGRYLYETIQSIVSQDYKFNQIIVIDGGSIDNTIDVINKNQDSIYYWQSQPDLGQADAINQGLQKSSGEIIAYINSDDCYLPGTFSKIIQYFDRYPEIDIVYGDIQIVDESSNVICTKKSISYDYYTELFSGSLIPQPATFFRRKVIEKVGLFDITLKYNMDTDFFIRCGQARLKFGLLPEPLAKFRIHPSSKTFEDKKIQDANIALASKYIRYSFFHPKIKRAIIILLRFLFRLKIFVVRALTRHVWIPNQFSQAITEIKRN
jgi:glycosyltransferase involved in cell wall biosynthesis